MKFKHFAIIGLALFVIFFLSGIGLPWLVSTDQLPLLVILAVLVITVGTLAWVLWQAYSCCNIDEEKS